jgi:ABC-type proline/glycine betaine transport system permease subunit
MQNVVVIGYWGFLIENYRQQRSILSQAIAVQTIPSVELLGIAIKYWRGIHCDKTSLRSNYVLVSAYRITMIWGKARPRK